MELCSIQGRMSRGVQTPPLSYTSVIIPNRRLLTMTVEEVDDHIEWVKFYCVNLTQRDLDVLQKQRKKVNNRIYARMSRLRKKDEVDGYLEEIERLREENAVLKAKVTKLEATAAIVVKQEEEEHPLFELELM